MVNFENESVDSIVILLCRSMVVFFLLFVRGNSQLYPQLIYLVMKPEASVHHLNVLFMYYLFFS